MTHRFLTAVFAFSIIFAAAPTPQAHAIEKPDYTVIQEDGKIEIREYPPMIIAEVTVEGDRKEAANKAFRKLADFIFGDNEVQSKIKMTSPVVQTPAQSEKIKMTSPVVQTPTADNKWVVNFMMPSKYTLETLPKPINDEITIRQTQPYKAITIRFSGKWKQSKLDKKSKELMAYVEDNDLKIVGAPDYAFYDPPFMPGFMRRNEVHFRLAD